jgi:C4-dicarboxylate-specific signal transduction histidine kinase
MNISQINTLSQEEVQREMQKAVEEKRVQFQFQHKLADGSIRNVEVFSSKVEIAGIKYLHSIIQDITEKMKAEEQLKLYREHLEELVELRTKELNEVNNKLLVEIEKEKEYEMLLKQALDKEKEINEIKSRFISTTSH